MSNDWTDGLKTLDSATLKPVYDELAGQEREASIELDADRKLVRRATARRCLNELRTANAAKTLESIPARGESWHLVIKGNFSLWDIVPAVLDLTAPSHIIRLDIATLGFSRSNVEQLAELLDRGTVRNVSLCYSIYFKSNEASLCDSLHHEMGRRGQRVFSCRTHAKVIGIELSTGDALVIESSANLRSCRNVEQLVITNDADLLAFHREWMDEIFLKAGKRGHR